MGQYYVNNSSINWRHEMSKDDLLEIPPTESPSRLLSMWFTVFLPHLLHIENDYLSFSTWVFCWDDFLLMCHGGGRHICKPRTECIYWLLVQSQWGDIGIRVCFKTSSFYHFLRNNTPLTIAHQSRNLIRYNG